MSGIRSVGRAGATIVPNWRWEDPELDPYQLRIAGWLASNTQGYTESYVTRNVIAKRTGISAGKVSSSIDVLVEQGIIQVETVDVPQSEGGRRWIITVDLDVWQRPRSPHDQAPVTTRPGPGHHMTATTGSSSVEEQEETPKPPLPALPQVMPELEDKFEQFWVMYGRVGSKKIARECWMRAVKGGADPEAILDGLEKWVIYWQHPNAASIKWPQGWLNERRWEGAPPPLIGAASEKLSKAEEAIAKIRSRDA